MNPDPKDPDGILAERVRTSRLLGEDSAFVLHGGGNTSAKGVVQDALGQELEVIWVKGSGWDLGTIESPGLPALDLARLRELRALDSMTDEVMVREVRRCMLDPSGPTPSVETLLHAFLPHRFIDHSHADAILALSNRENSEASCRALFGPRLAYLPYVMPGFPLALAVAEVVEANPEVEGVLLHKHGLFTFADTGQESLDLHREFVAMAATQYAEGKQSALAAQAASRLAAAEILPILRGCFDTGSFVMDLRDEPWMLAALEADGARDVLLTPPLTPDHAIRTKALPCWLDSTQSVAIQQSITGYVAAYQEYFSRGVADRGDRTELDPWPRLLLIPGLGLVGVGGNAKAAAVAADIGEHTVLTKTASVGLGPYVGLSDLDLFDMEYWSLEQAKLGKGTQPELQGKVAVITGGGGAIGEGVARVLLGAGAAVALLDRDLAAAAAAAERLGGAVVAVEADVTDETSMNVAMEQVCRHFGGLDILIPNAGIAHSASILDHDEKNWHRLLAVNQTGVFLTLRAGGRILQRQGRGGSVVLISSKNVLAPGADFSAYSASKAGAHQLAKVAAIEWAQDDVAVNSVCPDAVFRDGENSSGLWDEVGPDRAASRGLEPQELEAFYRQRNLLRAEVTADAVGQAVLFFAARRTPTTGGVLTVDGGVAAAFPR